MSNRSQVWQLLLKRAPNWVSRHDLVMVGGVEATRRVREVRADAASLGYTIEDRLSSDGHTLEYRAVAFTPPAAQPEGKQWRCVKCGTPGHLLSKTLDYRYRTGGCRVCKDALAVFRAESS